MQEVWILSQRGKALELLVLLVQQVKVLVTLLMLRREELVAL